MEKWTLNRRKFLGVVGLGAAGLSMACDSNAGVSPNDADGEGPQDTTDGDARNDTADPGDSSSSDPTDADATDAASAGPYNVLFLVVDQERYQTTWPAGFSLPGHERLAARGLTFRRHYANAMPCTPSRSVLYTGHQVTDTTMRSNIGFAGQLDMPRSLPTLGTLMKGRGYRTAYFGKWHLSTLDSGDDCDAPTTKALAPYGFDEFNTCGDLQGTVRSGHSDDPTTASAATAWLRARKDDPTSAPPWCLAVNFVNPHDIMFYYPGGIVTGSLGFDAPDDPLYQTRYDVTLPANARENLADRPAIQRAYRQLYDTMQKYPNNAEGDELLKQFINYYHNCIVDADRHLTAVLDALESSGLADKTIIVFTSDHGEMAQVHGLRGKGPFVYEENNHVPLIVAHPGYAGGRTTDALTAHVDLVPTLLSLVGQSRDATASASPGLAGLDLSPLLATPSEPGPRADLVMTFDFTGMVDLPGANDIVDNQINNTRSYMRGYTDGRYKFARFFAVRDYHTPSDWNELLARNDLECYDLESDPGEMNNLGAEPLRNRGVLEPLWRKLEAALARELGTEFPAE